MNYELAKELWDNGYIFKRWDRVGNFELDSSGMFGVERETKLCVIRDELFEHIWYLVPTLTELIEALGNNFYQLEKTPVSNWKAVGTNNGLEYIEVEALTSIEAVARLWLSLNKKD